MPDNPYIEMTAAIAVPPERASALDLLMGFHPTEERWLDPDDRLALIMLRRVRREELVKRHHRDKLTMLALNWLDCFPNIDQYWTDNDAVLYESLWRTIISPQSVLHLAYAFYPDIRSQAASKFAEVVAKAQRIQDEIDQAIDSGNEARGKLCWTTPFPALGPLGKVIETQVGLSNKVKRGLALLGYQPGLVCNMLKSRGKSIDAILDPYQFEDFVAILFREEGWYVKRMPRTHDGGKDVIAQRSDNGSVITVYVQAKRYSTSRRVGITHVKEFAATALGDGADKGVIVTTSYLSRPAMTWARGRGMNVAQVDFVDRDGLEERIQAIIDGESPAYLLY